MATAAAGDGWGRCAWEVSNSSYPWHSILAGTLDRGFVAKEYVCLPDGCYHLNVATTCDLASSGAGIAFELRGEYEDTLECERPPCSEAFCVHGGSFYDAPTLAPTLPPTLNPTVAPAPAPTTAPTVPA